MIKNVTNNMQELKNIYCSLSCMNDKTIKYKDYKAFLDEVEDDIHVLQGMIYVAMSHNPKRIVMKKRGKMIEAVFSNEERAFIIVQKNKIFKCNDISDYHKIGYKLMVNKV